MHPGPVRVVDDVSNPDPLEELLGPAGAALLDRLDTAVMVLDHQRTVRYLSPAAQQLLGYPAEEVVGRRCRLTTKGQDCEDACPLTAALESGEDRVTDFPAVYRTAEGHPLPLRVTVIVVRDGAGGVRGAVEILRPGGVDHGFYLQGPSETAVRLRARVAELAAGGGNVVVVGEGPAHRSVARAIHAVSGQPPQLFVTWDAGNGSIPFWPPGTLHVDLDRNRGWELPSLPPGWRLVAGATDGSEMERLPLEAELVVLPDLDERRQDLPFMLAAWVRDMGSGARVASGTLDLLSRMALDLGLERLEPLLASAVAAAGEVLDPEHVPVDGYGSHLVDELLRSEDPLAAMERCILCEILERSGWRVQEAADRLGISRVTLWRKMRDHGISRNR